MPEQSNRQPETEGWEVRTSLAALTSTSDNTRIYASARLRSLRGCATCPTAHVADPRDVSRYTPTKASE